MIRNHIAEKRENGKMVIHENKLNDNTVFEYYYIPDKIVLLIKFKEPLGSQKWIAKADIRR